MPSSAKRAPSGEHDHTRAAVGGPPTAQQEVNLDPPQVGERQPAVRPRVLPRVLSPAEERWLARRCIQLAAALPRVEEGEPPPVVNWGVQPIPVHLLRCWLAPLRRRFRPGRGGLPPRAVAVGSAGGGQHLVDRLAAEDGGLV